MPQQLKSLQSQKIAIIRRNGLGDLLMTLPLLFWCKRYLHCHLILVVDRRNEECARLIDNPPWDELWVMDRGNKYLSALKIVWRLRKEKLDLALSAKPSSMNLMIFLIGLSGARLRRCVISQKSFFMKLMEKMINWPILRKDLAIYPHQAQQVLHLLDGSMNEIDPIFFPRMKLASASSVHQFERICTECGLPKSPDVKRIYINLTNNRATSKLDPEQFFQVLRQIPEPMHIILGALPGDEQTLKIWKEALESHLGSKVALAIGNDLSFTLAALQQCDLIVTGDGGLMHIAAAVDRPLLALFGQTCVSKWSPLTRKYRCLYHPHAVNLIHPNDLVNGLKALLDLS